MHSNIVDCRNEDIKAGMPVELVFRKVDDQDWLLPLFKPV